MWQELKKLGRRSKMEWFCLSCWVLVEALLSLVWVVVEVGGSVAMVINHGFLWVWKLGFWIPTQLKNSRERTGSFWILSNTCFTLRGVRPVDNELSLAQSEWIRWLCATFTKSRSWPLGSGTVRWGIGIGFHFLPPKFPGIVGFTEVWVWAKESSKVENRRKGELLFIISSYT